MTIRHHHLGFTIVFHGGCYRVYDQVGNPGVADSFIRFRYKKQCERYIDELINCLINPAPEPEQTHRLMGYYSNNRDDGPMPAVLFPRMELVKPTNGCCLHVHYLFKRGGWCYCAKPVKRGSTRCHEHEFLPEVQLSPNEFRPRALVKM